MRFQTHLSLIHQTFWRPQSPFGPLLRPGQDPIPAPTDSNLPVPANPVAASHPCIGAPGRGDQIITSPPIQFSEGSPVRLTRFVEMPLDAYYASVNADSSTSGALQFVLKVPLRGVFWLRVDQWSTALGNRPRLRCGALFHVANRAVSFHGAARDVQKLDTRVKIATVLSSTRSHHVVGLSSLHSTVSSRANPLCPHSCRTSSAQ